MAPILPPTSVAPIAAPASISPAAQSGGSGFQNVLSDAISQVNNFQQNAQSTVNKFLNGDGELHNVALATQQAELSFQMFMQVRNKIVSAYQEVMRMQV